jgi:hypothetical protein
MFKILLVLAVVGGGSAVAAAFVDEARQDKTAAVDAAADSVNVKWVLWLARR